MNDERIQSERIRSLRAKRGRNECADPKCKTQMSPARRCKPLDKRMQTLPLKISKGKEKDPKGKGCLLVVSKTRSQNPGL